MEVKNLQLLQDIENPNDNLCDAFLYEIDRSIDSGNEKYILDAIKIYKGKIDDSYIKMGQRMLTSLVEEKIESMECILFM